MRFVSDMSAATEKPENLDFQLLGMDFIEDFGLVEFESVTHGPF